MAYFLARRAPPISFLAAVLIPSAAKIRQVGKENLNAFNYKQLYFNSKRRQKLPLSDRWNYGEKKKKKKKKSLWGGGGRW